MGDHIKDTLLIGIFMIREFGSALILLASNETVQACKTNAIEEALTQVRYLPYLVYDSLIKALVEVTLISPSTEFCMGRTIYTMGSKLHPSVHLASSKSYLKTVKEQTRM